MPRTPRLLSPTNIYHVTMRSVNKSIIFYDEQDYRKYLHCLRNTKETYPFMLYGYCLMDNHIHLLINPGTTPINLIFQSLGSSFVYWYNIKYQRVGHLFQSRFHSRPIETVPQFLVVLRYIHNNPVRAGIVSIASEYKWSSSLAYLFENDSFVDISHAYAMFESHKSLTAFLAQPDEMTPILESALDHSKKRISITDQTAIPIFRHVTGCETSAEFQVLSNTQKYEYLRQLYKRGFSVRQLSRICDVPKGTVEKILKK